MFLPFAISFAPVWSSTRSGQTGPVVQVQIGGYHSYLITGLNGTVVSVNVRSYSPVLRQRTQALRRLTQFRFGGQVGRVTPCAPFSRQSPTVVR